MKNKNKLFFYRTKHKWSHGFDKEWEYHTIICDQNSINTWIKEEIIEMAKQYDYSEHYRGIDYELVDVPPVEILDEKLKSALQKRINTTKYIQMLKRAYKRKVK